MKFWREYERKELSYIDKKINKEVIRYYEPSFADTETSNLKEVDEKGKYHCIDTWVYIWACSVGDEVYYGRYAEDFIYFMKLLILEHGLDEHNVLTVYFHNLSYDMSYFYSLIGEHLDPNPATVFVAHYKIIEMVCSCGITFKCSYRLVNKSLDKWCNDLNVEHKKKTGTKDYNAVFYPDDYLPDNEIEYQEYDILSLKECYYKELSISGYTYANVPLTSTGFVRRAFQKEYFKGYKHNREQFLKNAVNPDQYKRLTEAAMGGMTQTSNLYYGEKIYSETGIGHGDFDSHYPTQLKGRMPARPYTIYDAEKGICTEPTKPTLYMLKRYVELGYYYVMTLDIKDVKLKEGVTFPFIYISQLTHTNLSEEMFHVNGKVIELKGVYRMTITNFDWAIYTSQYHIKSVNILAVDLYSTNHLPRYMQDTIDHFYREKTRLKKKENWLKENGGSDAEIEEAHLNLMLSKARLNGIFGCCYTRIIREQIKIDLDTLTFNDKWDSDQALYDYYNKKKSCLQYYHGVFCTAKARYELWYVISKVIGYENALYCDTDSCFYIPTPENQKRIKEYNDLCRADSEKRGLYVDYVDEEGNKCRKYYHSFDQEKDAFKSKTFKSLHAKCYALEPDGKLECTIAGVGKWNSDHTISREMELASIDNLESGYTFTECGGFRSDYKTIRPFDYSLHTGGGCCLLPTTKTLSNAEMNEPYFVSVDDDFFTDEPLEE